MIFISALQGVLKRVPAYFPFAGVRIPAVITDELKVMVRDMLGYGCYKLLGTGD
jgi:hypothetical protein